MVRKYARKSEKRDSDVIICALRAVHIGMSVRAAAQEFGIPEVTLRRHFKNNRPTNGNCATTAAENSDSMDSEDVVTKFTFASSTNTKPAQPKSPKMDLIIKGPGHALVCILKAIFDVV